MKISICIPQYNRIGTLLRNLQFISNQSYSDLEIVISDDCSTDNTRQEIELLQKQYKYPLVYHRFVKNQGYDRNYRHAIECATGEYCFVLGNDDTLWGNNAMQKLSEFLISHNYPCIGYCNYLEGESEKKQVRRAVTTGVHGHGPEVALKHVNGFSFVGGIIYKRSTFLQYNTPSYDGSIYAQMYLGMLMIAKGATLFTIADFMVLKDLLAPDGSSSWSPVKMALPRTLKDSLNIKSGLLSVTNVIIAACRDAGMLDDRLTFRVLKRMYAITYPYWIIQYKHYGNYFTALGLMNEMNPLRSNHLRKLGIISSLKILGFYSMSSVGALLIPFRLFENIKGRLHIWVRKN